MKWNNIIIHKYQTMFCEICYMDYTTKAQLRAHYKTKTHRDVQKSNIMFKIIGEHVQLIPTEDDEKTINDIYKSHNYYEYIKVAQLVSRDMITLRSRSIFPIDISIYEEIDEEFLRQADRIQRANRNLTIND